MQSQLKKPCNKAEMLVGPGGPARVARQRGSLGEHRTAARLRSAQRSTFEAKEGVQVGKWNPWRQGVPTERTLTKHWRGAKSSKKAEGPKAGGLRSEVGGRMIYIERDEQADRRGFGRPAGEGRFDLRGTRVAKREARQGAGR